MTCFIVKDSENTTKKIKIKVKEVSNLEENALLLILMIRAQHMVKPKVCLLDIVEYWHQTAIYFRLVLKSGQKNQACLRHIRRNALK